MSEKPQHTKNKSKTIKQKNKKRRTRKNVPPNSIIKVPMTPTNDDLVKPVPVPEPITNDSKPIKEIETIPKSKSTAISASTVATEKSELVAMFLEMLTTIKLYHWNTHSYSRHKATDELHEKLSSLVDQFVEVMQGKMFSPNRIRSINEEIHAITPNSKEKMVDKVLYYIEQLKNLDNIFSPKKDSDLLNIRDEMMAHLNQFLYLFSFDEI